MKINRVGVDLAKNVFQLYGADHKGNAVWKRQLSRGQWTFIVFLGTSAFGQKPFWGTGTTMTRLNSIKKVSDLSLKCSG